MANKKFSEFELKTSTSDVQFVVGYNGTENVRISPSDVLGAYLPLAGGLMVGNTTHNDNVKSIYGTGNDLEIYHDGNNSYINEIGTGVLSIQSDGTEVQINKGSSEYMGRFITDAGVSLYYDSVKKFETTLLGATVTGDLLVTGTITGTGGSYLPLAGGTLTGALTGTSATFTGDVALTTGSKLYFDNGNTYISEDITDRLRFFVGGAEFMRFTEDTADSINFYHNATFAGDVTLSAAGSTGEIIRTTDNTEPYFAFQRNSGVNGVAVLNLEDGGHLAFDTGATGAVQSEKMRLDSSGDLGLGTSALTNSAGFATLSINGSTGGQIAFQKGGAAKQFIFNNDIDLSIYNQEAGSLKFFTSALQRMIIDASGNLGIGTATPESKMHIQDGSAGTVTASSESSLVVEGSSNTAINLLSPDNKQSSLYFGSPSDSIGCQIAWSHNVKDLVIGTAVTSGGEIAFKTGNNLEKMRLDSDGNLLVGKTAINGSVVGAELRNNGQCVFTADGDNALDLNRLTTDGQVANFRQSNTVVGNISVTGSATAFNTSSDYRLKEDLQDFKGLDLVSKIPVYDYKWKADESRSYGVMAHELAEVLPQAVSGDKDAKEMQSVDYSKIVPLLVKSIQELSAKLESLECQCKKK